MFNSSFRSASNLINPAVMALGLFGFAVACGDSESSDDGGAGAGAENSGSVPAGEACTDDSECEDAGAICREGDICTASLLDSPFEQECSATTVESCPGGLCIGLTPNAQEKTGLCSMPCDTDPTDCGDGAACVELGGRMVCLATCENSDECNNGFVCIDDPDGAGKACLVETTPS